MQDALAAFKQQLEDAQRNILATEITEEAENQDIKIVLDGQMALKEIKISPNVLQSCGVTESCLANVDFGLLEKMLLESHAQVHKKAIATVGQLLDQQFKTR